MVDPETFHKRTQHAEKLLRRKLKRRDGDLAQLLRQAGRGLPATARSAGDQILLARQIMDHPKLSRQLDDKSVSRNFRQLEQGLRGFDPRGQKSRWMLDRAVTIGLNLLILVGVLALFAASQGLFGGK